MGWRALWVIDPTLGAAVMTSPNFRKIATSFIQKKKRENNHTLNPNLKHGTGKKKEKVF